MSKRITVAIVAAGLLACGGPTPAQQAGAEMKRVAYPVQHGSAKELAVALNQHFKGEVDIQVLAGGAADFLLIRGGESGLLDVLKILKDLDRPPRTVSIELWVVTVAAGKGAGDKDAADVELNERQLTGPAEQVRTHLRDLAQKGKVANLKRIQLTAVEGQPNTMMTGESRPYVTGVNRFGGGGFGGGRGAGPVAGGTTNVINYRDVGTTVEVTPRVRPDGEIALALRVEDSTMQTPPDAVTLGTDDKGAAVPATEFVQASLNTKLMIAPAQAVLARGVQTESKSRESHTVMIVTARLAGPDSPRK